MEATHPTGRIGLCTTKPAWRNQDENSVEQDKKKVTVIQMDAGQLRAHVSELVCQSLDKRLNGLLVVEADPCARCVAMNVT